MLPAPVHVPTTPAIQAPDITAVYELFENNSKGSGAFSRVIVGREKATGALRAVKIMDRRELVGKKAEMVAHEREILRRARHPSIVHMHHCIQTADRVYFGLDLMQTDLFEYVVKRKRLSEDDTRLIMKQLLEAVAYLHEQSVVHRDIKPENILINTPSDIKLADFGLAKVVQEWDVRSTPCGTSFYIAPEIIRGIEAQGARPLCTTREVVKSIDLWSCGVVMFVIIAGRPPFAGQVKTSTERRQLLQKIDRGVLFPDAQWAEVSESAKDLILGLLNQDTQRRMTAAAALRHSFFDALRPQPSAATVEANLAAATISTPQPLPQQPGTSEAAPEAPESKAEVPPPVENRELTADERAIITEINALQEQLVETGDTDGDTTSYNPTIIQAPHASNASNAPLRPMNPKAVIGPGAFKK